MAPGPVKFGRSISLTASIRAASSMRMLPFPLIILRFSSRVLVLACVPCDARARTRPPPGSRPAGRWQNGVREPAREGGARTAAALARARAPGSGAGLRADAASGRKPV